MKWSLLDGVPQTRTAERAQFAKSPHEPPRNTRLDPLAGPCGFVAGLVA